MVNQKYTLGSDIPPREKVYDSQGNLIDETYIQRAVEDVHAALAGRPSLSGKGISPQVAFRVSTEVRDAATQLAQAEGISLSTFARRALEKTIGQAHKIRPSTSKTKNEKDKARRTNSSTTR